MIVRVARRALESGAQEVVVATDDERIVDVVTAAGVDAALTRADHESGSDRVMEVASARGWPEDAVVLNVQGDEPLIPPAVIAQLARNMTADESLASATLCEPVRDRAELFDPNAVKVVRDNQSNALYFSRAPVPYGRDAFLLSETDMPPGGLWWRHIGIYAYRVWALARFVSLPTGLLERAESLEQLRLLENGLKMRVAEAEERVPGGVDTPADLERVREQVGGSA